MDGELIGLIIVAALLVMFVFIFIKNPSKTKSAKFARGTIILILLVVLGVLLVKQYGPNGNNPVFSEAGRGDNEGRDTQESTAGGQVDSGEDDRIDFVVRGRTVEVNGNSYDCEGGNYTALDEMVKQSDFTGYKVFLSDDYAVSSVYHHVKELLENKGVVFEAITAE